MKNKQKNIVITSLIVIGVILAVVIGMKVLPNSFALENTYEDTTPNVVVDTSMTYNKSANTIDMNVYNGKSSAITINKYIYSSGNSTSYTTVALSSPVTIEKNSTKTITISNVSDKFSELNTDTLNVGVQYSVDGNLYNTTNKIGSLPTYDESKKNTKNNEQTAEEFTIYANTKASDWENNESLFNSAKMFINITDTNIHMEKTEKLEDLQVKYQMKSNYLYAWYFENPLKETTYRAKMLNQDNYSNYLDYFDYTYPSDTYTGKGAFGYDSKTLSLLGTPKQVVTDQTVIPTFFWYLGAKNIFNNWTWQHTSENGNIYTSEKIPQFKLTVYDKNSLSTAIKAAISKLENTTNTNDINSFISLRKLIVEKAIPLYESRKYYTYDGKDIDVNQANIDAVVKELNDFTIGSKSSANYQAYNEIIKKVESLNQDYIITDSYNKLKEVYDRRNDYLNITALYQVKVNNYVKELQDAYNSLEYKRADFTNIKQAQAEATNKIEPVREYFTAIELSNYIQALDTVGSILNKENDPNYNITKQSEIDEATNKLNKEIAILEQLDGNYTEIDKIINEFTNMKKTVTVANKTYNIYKQESLDTVQNAIDSTDRTIKRVKQKKINNQYTTIKSAIDSLVKNDGDYSEVIKALQDKINEVNNTNKTYSDINTALSDAKALKNKEVDNTTLYTAESFKALTDAINSVNVEKKANEQETIYGYSTKISEVALVKSDANYTNVIKELQDKINEVNSTNKTYSDVNTALSDAKALKNKEIDNTTLYTTESFNAFMLVLDKINTTKKIDAQQQVNNYVIALKAASLVKNSADYRKVIKELQDKINEVNNTSKIYNDINAALKDAKKLTNNNISYQEISYDKNGKITDTRKVTSLYKQEAFANLLSILNSIDSDKKIDAQDKVNSYVTSLKSIKLEKNKASYTTIDSYISYIKNTDAYKKNWYKGNGLKVINNYIASIDRTLTIDKQDKLDEKYNKLLNTVSNAEYKDANYGKINSLLATINGLNKNDFTNFDTVLKQIDSIVYGKKINKQSEVDTMYNNLLKAYNGLKKKKTDTPKEDKNNSNKGNNKNNSTNKNEDKTTTDSNKTPSKNENKNSAIIEEIKVNDDVLSLINDSYKYVVAYDVEETNLDIKLVNSKDTYTVEGPERLKVGANNYKIKVTSAAGASYTYDLTVVRKGSTQIEALSIKDTTIHFDKDIYEYDITLADSISSLDLNVNTVEKTAKVQILGNENLKDGSTVTIKVTSIDGTTKSYKLNIKKEQAKEEKKKTSPILFILPIVVIGVVGAYFGLKPKQGTV